LDQQTTNHSHLDTKKNPRATQKQNKIIDATMKLQMKFIKRPRKKNSINNIHVKEASFLTIMHEEESFNVETTDTHLYPKPIKIFT
jgi:hypothetical protein